MAADGPSDVPNDAIVFYRRAGFDEARLDRYRSRFGQFGANIAPLPAGYRRITDGQYINIGDREWRAIIGHGHAPEHVCLYCPELKLIIGGDQLLPRITPNVSVQPSEPFANPLKSSFRFSSPFGYRRDPKTGGRRMHSGTDFAAGMGTPIHSTAEGVVTHAGWSSGYGRLVKIQHEFGVETRYAHMSKLRVKVGQRVSRGQRIGDMGTSGRSTGVHLHYEVRVGGKAVNPMIFIKAANDVF